MCGQFKYRGDSKLITIQFQNVADDLLNAAITKQDDAILPRIWGEKLIAKNGKYHHKCMQNDVYVPVPQTNIAAVTDKSKVCHAYQNLFDHIEKKVIQDGKMLVLKDACKMYNEFISDVKESDSPVCTTRKTKEQLKDHFGKRIKVEKQASPGSPDVIIWSDISVCNAGKATQNLKEEHHNMDVESHHDEMQEKVDILRSAAAILKNEIDAVQKSNSYPLPNEVKEHCAPPLLRQLMTYLLDSRSFDELNYSPSEEKYIGKLRLYHSVYYRHPTIL